MPSHWCRIICHMSWGYRPWRPSNIGYFRVPFIVTDIFIYCITITYALLMFVQMKLFILWFVPWTSWRMWRGSLSENDVHNVHNVTPSRQMILFMSCWFYVSSICQRFVLVYLVGPAAHTRFMERSYWWCSVGLLSVWIYIYIYISILICELVKK